MRRIYRLLYIATVLMVATIFLYDIVGTKNRLIKDTLHNIHLTRYKAFSLSIQDYHTKSNLIFETSIDNESVKSLQYMALHSRDESKRAIYRQQLLELLQPLYKDIVKYGVKQLHFHFPNSTSFLRFHKPSKFGDDLSKIRESVNSANRTKKVIYAFEEGKIFNSFRAVYPLFYKNKHIGSVEISTAFNNIKDGVEDILGGHVYLVFNREHIEDKHDTFRLDNYEESQISVDLFHEKGSLKEFEDRHKIDNTHISSADISTVMKYLKSNKNFQKELGSYKSISRYLHLNGKSYVITLNPIRNFSGNNLGYIIHLDYDNQIDTIKTIFKNNILITLLVLLIVSIAIYWTTNSLLLSKREKRILNIKRKSFIRNEETAKLGTVLISIKNQEVLINREASRIFHTPYSTESEPLKKYLYILDSFEKGKFALLREILRFIKKNSDGEFEHAVRVENHLKYIKGRFRRFKSESGDIELLFTLQDITEEKLSQDKLKEYLSIIESSVITSKTDIDGYITYASDRFSDISGYEKEELIGKKHSILKSKDTPQTLYKELWDTILSGKEFDINLIKNVGKNGKEYWLKKRITPEFNLMGDISGFTEVAFDITNRVRFEELSITTQTILDTQSNMVVVIKKREILIANKKFLNFAGVSSISEFQKRYRSISSLFIKSEDHFFADNIPTKECIHRIIADSQERVVTVKMYNREKRVNEIFSLDITFVQDKHSVSYVLSFTNITNIVEESIQYKYMATHDVLTDSYNKLYFNDMLKQHILSALRYKEDMSLTLFDIDHFKKVNDQYGHMIGDMVLKQLSLKVKSIIRDSDTFARWGGEEFAVLTPHTDRESASILAEKLRREIEMMELDVVRHITSSFGVTQIIDGDTPEKVLTRCDDALYKAKKSGRNCVKVN